MIKNSIVILLVLVFAVSASAATVYFEENFNGALDNPADLAIAGTAVWNGANTGLVLPVDDSIPGENRLAFVAMNTDMLGGGSHTHTLDVIDFDMSVTDNVWAHPVKMQANIGDTGNFLTMRVMNWAGWWIVQGGYGDQSGVLPTWSGDVAGHHYSWGPYSEHRGEFSLQIDVQSFGADDWQVDFNYDIGAGMVTALSMDETSDPGLITDDLGLAMYRTELVAFEATPEDSGAWTTATLDKFVATPEPMTLSLLGLGGLALIRRRRA